MPIWLLMHLMWQRALKGRNVKLIMKPSLVESLHGVEDARFKALFMAKDYTQKEGVDFNEMFSLVVKHSSISLELKQIDVKIAFLHGELK
ncbi:hypothetical protein AAG906_015641 [Vitis piasezkii]